MPAYDSDSSSDDGDEYTTTNVILGYANKESSGDEISHIGGHPTWLDSKSQPSGSLASCKVCSGNLSLLLQLNADLQSHFPQDTRRVYVWGCRNKSCRRKPGSVRGFREVKKPQTNRQPKPKDVAPVEQKPAIDLGAALFGGAPSAAGGINPFSKGGGLQDSSSNPFGAVGGLSTLAAKPPQIPVSDSEPLTQTFAEKLKINSPPSPPSKAPEPWPSVSAFPEPYPFFYLDAYPEELEPTSSEQEDQTSSSKTQYDVEDSSSAAAEKDTSDMNIDKTFQKFSDIVAQNPEQVLRYEFKGAPLLYSGVDGVASRFVVPHGKAGAVKGLPRCEYCSSPRVFELQLTPYLIFEIEKDEAMDIEDGMEWGTIVMATCASNCGEDGAISFKEEWVGVQWEEILPKK